MGKDTNIDDFYLKKYKILTYIDTAGCTSCKLRLFDWRVFIKELQTLSSDVVVLFVLFSKDYNEFEEIQRKNKFEYPVLYDRYNKLNTINHFPENPAFQTFLLDQNNRVIAIGNPIMNDAIRIFYENIIKEE